METMKIVEAIIGVSCVMGLLWAGIFIGREFGTLEKFGLVILDKLKDKFKNERS